MPVESRHLTVVIRRSPAAVVRFAGDPANLPAWAAGLASGIRQQQGRWFADSPMGAVEVVFAAPNGLGVLDHDVVLPDGSRTHNPLRVLPYGDDAEVVFSLRREPGVTDEAFAADARAVREDLERLKAV
ncbi:MAG TPA: SRPBCC family protein, partial [Amnibacterium sp.]|nr:SRPBCC family protein [Amnibacterium sp.]